MEFLEKAIDVIMTKQIFGTAMVIFVTFLLITIINKGIEKIMIKGKTSFEVNGEKLFELTDKELYSDGYFGIRLLSNRAAITGFTIHYL